MPPLSIRRLPCGRAYDAQAHNAWDDRPSFEEVLKTIYVDSKFIDPIEEIANKIRPPDSEPLSIPFGAYLGARAIAFFTIDFSNPPLDVRYNPTFLCWLESFMVAQDCQGHGVCESDLESTARSDEQNVPPNQAA